MKKDDGLWALWETAFFAVFQAPVGALFASMGAAASTAPRGGACTGRRSTQGLTVTPEAPGQIDSIQYRQVQFADLIEQRRGRGPGEGCRQRVPPRPVLVLQRQERLHRVVPLLGPRSPVRRRRYRTRDSPAFRRSR